MENLAETHAEQSLVEFGLPIAAREVLTLDSRVRDYDAVSVAAQLKASADAAAGRPEAPSLRGHDQRELVGSHEVQRPSQAVRAIFGYLVVVAVRARLSVEPEASRGVFDGRLQIKPRHGALLHPVVVGVDKVVLLLMMLGLWTGHLG
jgi:hypothetical protein